MLNDHLAINFAKFRTRKVKTSFFFALPTDCIIKYSGKMILLKVFFIFILCLNSSFCDRQMLLTTDDLENHVCPEDLEELLNMNKTPPPVTTSAPGNVYADFEEDSTSLPVPDTVDCFGLGAITQLSLFNMRPASSSDVNTHFYFSSRTSPKRVQVHPGRQFGLEWVDFDPGRKTVMIVHGFMSHSNASWVHDMTAAFLAWADVNVIAVDWSGGGNTWKYWRAVANTRRVGSDVTGFLQLLIARTGARVKDFHFVGHSLGAHISSYVSFHLGGVARITGLDPAQPCFRTPDRTERLDESDADFVDVIHTNGRLLKRIGFGLPDPTGHADFYPNGGMRQPGCMNNSRSLWQRILPPFLSPAKIRQAICSHGRAYLLFTESLINDNCTFRAHRWNLTYEGVNTSLVAACERASCAEMGISAAGGRGLPRARGPYFVLTTEREPYCPTEWERRHPQPDLLWDLRQGFRLDGSTKSAPTTTDAYADPELVQDFTMGESDDVTTTTTTTARSWWWWLG